MDDDLEQKCKQAVLRIADHVQDINHKLTYFLQNYREDYMSYQKNLSEYQP